MSYASLKANKRRSTSPQKIQKPVCQKVRTACSVKVAGGTQHQCLIDVQQNPKLCICPLTKRICTAEFHPDTLGYETPHRLALESNFILARLGYDAVCHSYVKASDICSSFGMATGYKTLIIKNEKHYNGVLLAFGATQCVHEITRRHIPKTVFLALALSFVLLHYTFCLLFCTSLKLGLSH